MTKPSSGRLSIIPASAIAAQLAGRAEQLCRHLLPEGRRKGCEWRCGSVQGDKGNSLGVHLNGDKAGIWSDFATGDSGDALDLVKAVQGLDTDGAIAWAKNWLGLNSGSRRPPASNSRANGTTPTSSNKAPPDRHPHLGEPTLRHEYTDAEGRLIFYHCRFDLGGGKKTFRPLSRQDGKWAWKDPPGALPLYGLADLAAHAEKPVLLVEGEKTAEVFRELVDDYVNMTWPHGAKAIHKIDWSPLKGRDVTAWPDADGEGHKAMQAAAAKITEAGAGRVAIVALPNGHRPVHRNGVADQGKAALDTQGRRRPRRPLAHHQLHPPCPSMHRWRSPLGAGQKSARNLRKAPRSHPSALDVKPQQRPHGGPQRSLPSRSGKGTRIPKHRHLHHHDLPDRRPARKPL